MYKIVDLLIFTYCFLLSSLPSPSRFRKVPVLVSLYATGRKKEEDAKLTKLQCKYVDSVMHSTVCDLSIDDLWSSFREELTSGIKRFIPRGIASFTQT